MTVTTMNWLDLLLFPHTTAVGGTREAAAVCGFRTKNFKRDNALTEIEVPPCEAGDPPAHIVRTLKSVSHSFSGSGVLDRNSLEKWRSYMGQSWRFDIALDEAGSEGGYYHGMWIMSSFEITANHDDGIIQFTAEFQSAGAIGWTNAP